MLVIIGFIVVTFSVIGGFLLEGGHIHVLFQPIELLIIGGAAFGSLLISSPLPLVKRIIGSTLATLKPGHAGKDVLMELLMLLYELLKTGKGNMLSLEAHVENPDASEIFKKYPQILHNHHIIHYIADTLKIQISSPVSPYDLDDLLSVDMDVTHREEHQAPSTITRLGDSMPGLGIVAAVLGVVITMGKLTEGKEVIGHSVAAALVGTFLGILLSYGYFQPLAAKIESNMAEEGVLFEVVKATLVAFAKDCSPKVCVEFGRRSIPPEIRPSFKDVDGSTQNVGKKAA